MSDKPEHAGSRIGSQIDRREFLRRSALTGLGLSALPLVARATEAPGAPAGEQPEPRVRRRVRLGRTGLEISDIGFGSSRLSGDERLVQHAFERGINYFDTAEGYTDGESETTIGRALAGKRDQVVLTSKLKVGPRERRGQMMESLEASLRRLRTDRIDVYLNHAVNDPARLENPEWPEFVRVAKKQGKIRFSGMSGHGGRLAECLDIAIDDDLADVVLVAFNFGQDPTLMERFTRSFDFVATQPELPRVLAKAKQKDVGVVAMKTLMGARLNDLRPYEKGGATFAQAAFRWVLSSANVDSLVVTMKSEDMIDEYLGASGWEGARTGDDALLGRYLALNSASQCRYGCSDCRDACPAGVPISDVLRARMYARDYGEPDRARSEYAGLGDAASPCISCAKPVCAASCSYGLPVDGLTRHAHELLA